MLEPMPMAYSLGDILASTAQLQPKPKTPPIRSARSRNRAAAWAYDLEKWRQYHLAMATTDARRADVEADYERHRAAGPDFAGYHARSTYDPPPLCRITREDRIKILTAFDAIRNRLHECREPRGQAVSKNYKEVLSILLSFAVKFGKVFPSLDTLARMAKVCRKTVLAALAWLRLWKFIDRQIRRLQRVATGMGPRARQASNAYHLGFPGRLDALGGFVAPGRTDGNNCTPSRSTGAKQTARVPGAANQDERKDGAG
jgi:hypothetical protein